MSKIKNIIVFACLVLFPFVSVGAQDDAESVVTGDIEIEGFENLWIQCSIADNSPAVQCERDAAPRGGRISYLRYVQGYMGNVLKVLADKYTDEMLNMVGSHHQVFIVFSVNQQSQVEVAQIVNGRRFGLDMAIAQKLFDDGKRWTPAKCGGESASKSYRLLIDVSL